MALISNMQHFLDEYGVIPAEMPGPVRNIALFLGAIVAWVTVRQVTHDEQTNVPCRRSPNRRRCSGTIYAGVAADAATIVWECPVCGDTGMISGWEGTPWDRRNRPH